MNEWHKKNEHNLLLQARMRCFTLFRYGKSIDEVRDEIENSFYTDKIIKLIVENLSELQKKSQMPLKKRIKFPNIQ